ncbi:toll/interleukin-1 receptor domain-containing protein [Cupriavidus necator]|uniref:toll/interleukin-1 receptor domain-containing protein n=1 Tax=Cupriavidus necator TaxID=106590 RepID=UPI0039C3CFF6
MGAIFLSYRRDDSEGQAGRLYDELAEHFGADAVFMDVAAIEPGRDFRRVIDEQVSSCGVLLALIGKNWLDATDETGRRRLDDPMDFVRLETASALRRDIPVVPVLVHGARMPRVEELPKDLAELAFRNGVELTHARWNSDVQVLQKALRPYVQPQPAPAEPPAAPAPIRPGKLSRPTLAGIAAAVVVVGAGGYMLSRPDRIEQVETPGPPLATVPAPAVDAKPAAAPAPNETAATPPAPAPETPAAPSMPSGAGQGRDSPPDADSTPPKSQDEGQTAQVPPQPRGLRWRMGNFPPPNAGKVLFTIMPSGDPACMSYNGASCLWGLEYKDVDFTQVKPLVCGDPHNAVWGSTGYDNPKHWCSLVGKRSPGDMVRQDLRVRIPRIAPGAAAQ